MGEYIIIRPWGRGGVLVFYGLAGVTVLAFVFASCSNPGIVFQEFRDTLSDEELGSLEGGKLGSNKNDGTSTKDVTISQVGVTTTTTAKGGGGNAITTKPHNSGGLRKPSAFSKPDLYCSRCKIKRPVLSHHCYDCDLCILDLDHHCPWTGKCIGRGNLWFFYIFLTFLCMLVSFSGVGLLAFVYVGWRD